jgi:hypothetical protein
MATSFERDTSQSAVNVTKHLKGIDFPASKPELVRIARQLKAEQVVIDQIQKLEDREYESMAEVIKALGQEEVRGSSQRGSMAGQEKAQQVKQDRPQSKPTHHR